MKTLCTKIVTFFLIGMVFITSSGFGLISHTCLMQRKKSASYTEKEGCCSSKADTCATHTQHNLGDTILKPAQCCETSTSVLAIDLAPIVDKVGQFVANTFIGIIHTFFNIFNAMLQNSTAIHQSSDSSPPLAGKEILLQKQTLQI